MAWRSTATTSSSTYGRAAAGGSGSNTPDRASSTLHSPTRAAAEKSGFTPSWAGVSSSSPTNRSSSLLGANRSSPSSRLSPGKSEPESSRYGTASGAGSPSNRTGSLARSPLSQQPWGNVRYCAIARSSTRAVVTSHTNWVAISQDKYTEVCSVLLQSKMAEEAQRHSIKVDERGQCTCCRLQCNAVKETGALHFESTTSGWLFVVITAPGYSQSLASTLIDEVKRTFEEQEDLYSAHDADRAIARRVQMWLPALCDRYDKLDTNTPVRELVARMDSLCM